MAMRKCTPPSREPSELVKVDSVTMKSLPNVRFEFKLVGGSYRQEFVTDINGEIDLSKLTPGAYEVRELEAPDGYLMLSTRSAGERR